jgi:hypothetical protein
MSTAETILSTAFKIFDRGDVPVAMDARRLGMAYAIPRGSAPGAVQAFGPWTPGELSQVFVRQGALGEALVEVQLVLSWRASAARQYIVEAFLDKKIFNLDPTVRLAIAVRFSQPEDAGGEPRAFRIPFQVEVTSRAPAGFGATQTRISRGVMRADATGEFPAFD